MTPPVALSNPRLHPAGPYVLMERTVVPLTGHVLRTSGRSAGARIARG